MPKLFLSHIHEESSLAVGLKDWIEGGFSGQVDVFVSSDLRSLPPGSRWFDEIRESLTSSVAMLILCSPISVARPWVNFEAGVGWEKNVPVIPICHSGLERAALPMPLSTFQALEVDDQQFSANLFQALSRHLSFSRTPRLDFNQINRELVALTGKSPAPAIDPESTSHLRQEELEILLELAKSMREVTRDALSARFKIEPQKMQYYLDELKGQKLIGNRLAIGSPATYYLSKEGRRILVELGRL